MKPKEDIRKEVLSLSDPEKALFLSRFFKTGKGEYAEGDTFLGIQVPVSRKIAKKYRYLDISELSQLLESPYHEMRLISLIILADQFIKGEGKAQKKIYELYCNKIRFINNWDLVDESAPKIPGRFLLVRDRAPLYDWVKSKNLWKRRISIMSTFAFIREGDYSDTLQLCEILLNDPEDLIHKATGWMLREIYKRNPSYVSQFLETHSKNMPRTMLRYAIEKHPEKERKRLMEK